MNYFIPMVYAIGLISCNSYSMEKKDYPKFPEWVIGKPAIQRQNDKSYVVAPSNSNIVQAISSKPVIMKKEELANNHILRLSQEDFYDLLDQSGLNQNQRHTIKMWYHTPLAKRINKEAHYLKLGQKDNNDLAYICHNEEFQEHRYCLEKLKGTYERLFNQKPE